MSQFEEKTLATTPIFNGRIIDVQVDEVRLPNGETSNREIVKHPGAVAIIPVTGDDKIVFVKQYRKPLEKTLVEIPAGKLEEGEAPEMTAIRELEEETGYTTNQLKLIQSFYTSPGFADELVHLYFTNDLQRLDTPKLLDEDEFVEIMELTLEEAEKLMENQEIHDAKTVYAIFYLKLQGLR
ncbi:NUDIX hydrolase [Gracilibacillus alcaliphilus]|uniref:NUDIX hydrolase n=1 Tax=Gracilibacillus alcaliphilus TaxID=1401441 RepID=UPI001958275C|nr:NUDIX hydrolase [Gracilibacillus alcaliphilus]MBM7675106.1 ADP-ribose pyrophosphatase [Gracilibacillus alcaliphilus]